MYLIFDTETTGLPHNKSAPVEELDNWPRLVQIAWQLHDQTGKLISTGNHIINPEGFTIPFNAEKIHGISTKRAQEVGEDLSEVLDIFSEDVKRAEVLVGHNIEFDNKIIGAEYLRKQKENLFANAKNIDTALDTKEFCQLQGGIGGRLKSPKLVELYEKLFGEPFADAHDAAYDVDATAKAFFECLKRAIIPTIDDTKPEDINYEAPDLDAANFATKREKSSGKIGTEEVKAEDIKGAFCHLHGHSQFSVLQATPDVGAIVAKAKSYEMPAVAMTDLGNMFGAFKFVKAAKGAGIKPIIGCEFYVAEERLKLQFTKDNPDKRFKQLLLAKSKKGYENLIKLSSIAYKEGNYGLYPRIDKALIEKYKEDLIALSGSLGGEIPHLVLNVGETQAEKALLYWKNLFGDDFYLEINRHGLEEENRLNEILVDFSKKHDVKLIAANEYFYLDREDAKAHDVLICIKENEKQSTPIGRGRGFRPGLPNDNYYFKTQQEMKESFGDIPDAIENISTLVDKIEEYSLERDVLLPAFDIPEEFIDPGDNKDGGKRGENAYLKHLTYEGAKKRYDEITDEIRDRIDFELETIANTGYPGYFLIVQDFTAKAREMNVAVGPGRGSAAGSVVAYCIGITNVDPIAYDLLFERFLNPDRVSLPDIDIDFDNEGREKVINYVIDKYGKDQVAQIITYGTMAPKSAIRDAGRVMELPLPETDAIAKLVPEQPGTKFSKVFAEVKELQDLKKGKDLPSQVLNQAVVLEGSLRNTGVHACGVIITPDDMSNFVPLAKQKDSEMMVTQFDNSVVESAGMLKMDFLGLKTLSIIKTAVENVEKRHGIKINIDDIPLDDQTTYELYQRGETNGTFQFESPGMQKHLRALKPDKFEDLIAMNALYRPGPMEYIPNFIARKHGKEAISYDIPEMEEYLAETYGITVYQEQVMLLSQSLAGFTKGEADVLRKAMGKKKRDVLDEMKPKFIEQAKEKGHPEDKLEKVWTDWEAFAAYAFNKSHSTCYSVVAYHTGYLKANYPAEYMASVLTHNQSSIDKVSFFMEECKNRNIPVLGPHVNESQKDFAVNADGEIRFGMGAIKGTGESAVQAIIEERDENGPFSDIFDFAKRVNLRTVNKKSFESLAKAGGFDCFEEFHRRQYVEPDDENSSLIEKSIRYANRMQEEEASNQSSLFGGASGTDIAKPKVGRIEPYGDIEKLNIEKEMVGLYISGHPLNQFKFEMDHLTNAGIHQLSEPEKLQGREVRIGGIVSDVQHRTSKKGNPFGQFTLEDFNDNYTFYLFSQDYLKFKPMLEKGWFLYLTGNIQNRWNSEELEFKIQNIEHLSEIREKMTRGLELKMRLEDVNAIIVDEVERIAEKFPGKSLLKMSLVGVYENRAINLEMLSRKFTIDPTDELIKELQGIEELHFRVLLQKN
ncbi:DNA polymerase III subunit alpha [Ekhidna sp.]|uniref:DNA polymerase III subunit alpha n=1 Tax=Ekhidna sp. TaxID=2608089 RepID=UPI003299E636